MLTFYLACVWFWHHRVIGALALDFVGLLYMTYGWLCVLLCLLGEVRMDRMNKSGDE